MTSQARHEGEGPRYNSTLAGKGALISETKAVLRAIDAGADAAAVRASVIEEDLLDRQTRESRGTYWREIFRRYISQRDESHVRALARFAAHCPSPIAVDLVLFYEYCHADPLLRDLTIGCAYPLYENARTGLGKVDIDEWLAVQEKTGHPEIASWSRSTRTRLIRNYLTTIRDFGLVTGTRQKSFRKVYVPREAFVYAVYHQKDRGIRGKALLASLDWRLYLMDGNEVTFMLEDADSGGHVRFLHAGDIVELRFIHDDLGEAVDAIIGR